MLFCEEKARLRRTCLKFGAADSTKSPIEGKQRENYPLGRFLEQGEMATVDASPTFKSE